MAKAKMVKVDVRKESGSREARRLRRAGRLPAVVYGAGKPARLLSLDMHETLAILHARERVVDLEVGGAPVQALIKEVQYDALGEEVLHVDLHELIAGATVDVNVAVVVRGVPKGQVEGGVLNHVLHELKVQCLPGDIPENVKVDVSEMVIGDIRYVKDLQVPPNVKVLDDPEAAVVICQAPHEEKEPEPEAAGAEPVEPEVLTARKEEPEAAEGEAGKEEKGAPKAKKEKEKEEK